MTRRWLDVRLCLEGSSTLHPNVIFLNPYRVSLFPDAVVCLWIISLTWKISDVHIGPDGNKPSSACPLFSIILLYLPMQLFQYSILLTPSPQRGGSFCSSSHNRGMCVCVLESDRQIEKQDRLQASWVIILKANSHTVLPGLRTLLIPKSKPCCGMLGPQFQSLPLTSTRCIRSAKLLVFPEKQYGHCLLPPYLCFCTWKAFHPKCSSLSSGWISSWPFGDLQPFLPWPLHPLSWGGRQSPSLSLIQELLTSGLMCLYASFCHYSLIFLTLSFCSRHQWINSGERNEPFDTRSYRKKLIIPHYPGADKVADSLFSRCSCPDRDMLPWVQRK